ncbi:MAG: hypothetical protein WA003_08775 [Desulfuromonadaceae bacterium]
MDIVGNKSASSVYVAGDVGGLFAAAVKVVDLLDELLGCADFFGQVGAFAMFVQQSLGRYRSWG